MTNTLSTWVEHGGLIAVLLLMLIESCGIPFPSEVIMPTAGLLAGLGKLSLIGAIFAGALGNLLGSLLAYALAARFGESLLLGPGRRVGLSKEHLEMADRWFSRYGLWAVLGGRILPVIRTYVSFPAGLARVRVPAFAALTFLGSLPWCAALALAGYELGSNYNRISGAIERAAIVIAVLVVAALAAWFIRGRKPKAVAR